MYSNQINITQKHYKTLNIDLILTVLWGIYQTQTAWSIKWRMCFLENGKLKVATALVSFFEQWKYQTKI